VQEKLHYEDKLTTREKIEKSIENDSKYREKRYQEDEINLEKAQSQTEIGMSLTKFRQVWKYFQGSSYSISLKSNKTQSVYGNREQFILNAYGSKKYYYFRDGILTTISD